jgi:hypothetical protein
MTMNYPETGAAPNSSGFTPPRDPYVASTTDPLFDEPIDPATDEPVGETIVPIYARKPVKRSGGMKAALIAVPVILALGVGAWALTAGQMSRERDAEPTDSLTTSRLDVRAPVSPEVTAPAVTETPDIDRAVTPAPVVAPPVVRTTRTTVSSAPAPRRAAPARPARRTTTTTTTTTQSVALPATPQPYSGTAVVPIITDHQAPVMPPSVAPTPTLPTPPVPPETPPATTTPPGGGA